MSSLTSVGVSYSFDFSGAEVSGSSAGDFFALAGNSSRVADDSSPPADGSATDSVAGDSKLVAGDSRAIHCRQVFVDACRCKAVEIARHSPPNHFRCCRRLMNNRDPAMRVALTATGNGHEVIHCVDVCLVAGKGFEPSTSWL